MFHKIDSYFAKLNFVTNGFFSSGVVGKKASKRKHSRKRKKYQAEHLVILILLILFGIHAILVSFVGYVTCQEKRTFYSGSITEMQVPCEDLSLSADEDFITFGTKNFDLKTFIDDNGQYICGKYNVTEVIDMVVERKSRIRLAQGLEEQYLYCGNESLAEESGHLTVSFTEISKHQNHTVSDAKLIWDQHQDKCHIDPSINYHNGEVIIPEGRTYFVYASVHFNISLQCEDGIQNFRRPQRFSIRICKNVYGYEQTLLGRIESFDLTNTETAVSSLSVGSHLELSRNDKIYVRVNDANKIVHDSKGNTFGLFPL